MSAKRRIRAHDGSDFAFIIGAMKSGTTSLWRSLRRHPEICACNQKEPQYFSRKIVSGVPFEDYLRLWKFDPKRHRLRLEASTTYTKYPLYTGVPERIREYIGPMPRFVYMMRDPIERIESALRHMVHAYGTEPLDKAPLDRNEIEWSRYAMQLGLFKSVFGRERILPIVFEEFCADPAAVLARVCRFLDVDERFEFRGVHKRANPKEMYVAYRIPFVTHVLRLLPYRWHSAVADSRFAARILRKDLGRLALNESERARVRALLAEDIALLREEWGVDPTPYWHV